jgi:hypothetical protein
MRITALGCSWLLAAGLAAVPATVATQKDTETVNRTVSFPDRGRLELHNFSGRVLITGTSGRDVVIKAVRRADRDRLDHIKLDIRTEGSAVVIEANKRDSNWHERNNNVVETEFDIQVPASAALDVDCFSSDVEIRGVTGDQKLHTFSGDMTVKDAKGVLSLDTFSGGLDIDLAGAGASPELRAKTFNGDIRVRLAADAKAEVSFTTHSGDFDAAMPVTLRSSRRSRISGELGGSGGRTLDFNTFSGDVRIVK